MYQYQTMNQTFVRSKWLCWFSIFDSVLSWCNCISDKLATSTGTLVNTKTKLLKSSLTIGIDTVFSTDTLHVTGEAKSTRQFKYAQVYVSDKGFIYVHFMKSLNQASYMEALRGFCKEVGTYPPPTSVHPPLHAPISDGHHQSHLVM